MKKKPIALILSLFLTLSLFPSAPAVYTGGESFFSDVSESSPYYADIDYVYQTGLMNGVGGGKFNPDGLFSRAMFVTILGRMEGIDPADYPGSDFTDVSMKSLSWAAPYIKWASENGIVNGYGDGTFAPNDTITKEQYCTVVDRYCNAVHRGFVGTFFTPYFKDASAISDYAFAPVYNLVGYGLIDTEDGFFSPKHPMSRGEIAVTFAQVHRMLNQELPSDLTTNYIMSNFLDYSYNQVISVFSGDVILGKDNWWYGSTAIFASEYGYPPFDFSFRGLSGLGCAVGSEPVTLVAYVTGRGFPSVMAAPGISANSTVSELEALGVPGVLRTGSDTGTEAAVLYTIDYESEYSIVYYWYSADADPYTEKADVVAVLDSRLK